MNKQHSHHKIHIHTRNDQNLTSTALKLYETKHKENHTHTYTQKKLLAAFRPKILYENKKQTKITQKHYKKVDDFLT